MKKYLILFVVGIILYNFFFCYINIGGAYYTLHGNIYFEKWLEPREYTTFEKIPNTNIFSFRVLSDSSYAKDADFVYFHNKHEEVKIINGADPETFIPLDLDYSMDKSFVYFETEVLDYITPSSDIIVVNKNILKNNEAVYFGSKKITSIDVDTFEVMEECGFCREKFSWTKKIKGNLSVIFSRDKNSIYYYSYEIIGSDPSTFQRLSPSFGKDANNVYFRGLKIENADSASFEVLENGNAKDKNYIYLRDRNGNNEVLIIENNDGFLRN